MDSFDEAFEEVKMPVTSISMILYSGYRVIKDKKSFAKLTEEIRRFLDGYEDNEVYKQYLQSGTGNSENVRGRFDFWRDIIKNL